MMPDLLQIALLPAALLMTLALPAAVYLFSRDPDRRRRALRLLNVLTRR